MCMVFQPHKYFRRTFPVDLFCAQFSRPTFSGRQNFPGGGIFASRLNLDNGGIRMKLVSKNKLSKKARRELDKQQRVTWDFSPVSRVKPSKKVYNRRWSRETE